MKLKTNVIQTACSCGEPIFVEKGRYDLCRKDGLRPFYPDAVVPTELDSERYNKNNVTVFRCRKCKGWIGDTCKEAAFGKETK